MARVQKYNMAVSDKWECHISAPLIDPCIIPLFRHFLLPMAAESTFQVSHFKRLQPWHDEPTYIKNTHYSYQISYPIITKNGTEWPIYDVHLWKRITIICTKPLNWKSWWWVHELDSESFMHAWSSFINRVTLLTPILYDVQHLAVIPIAENNCSNLC